MESNELILKLDKETTIPLIEGLGKSAYAIAVAHGFRGTEQEWLDSLKGLQGPQGEPGDKGEKGDTPTVPNTVRFLKEGHVYLPNEDLDTVLLTALKVINIGVTFIRSYGDIENEYPFTVDTFNDGDENITVHGYDHFKVQIGNETPVEILNNIAIVPVPKNTDDFINVKYINFLGEVVESKNVQKVKEDDTPAVVYQDSTDPNMKLSVKGAAAVLEFIPNGRYGLNGNMLKPLNNKVKRLVIDLADVGNISGYVRLPFIPEKIQIINYTRSSLNLSFRGNYSGITKIVSEIPVEYSNLNSNNEYEVSSLNGKTIIFDNNHIYIIDEL